MNMWESLKHVLDRYALICNYFRKEKLWEENKLNEPYESEVKMKLEHRDELGSGDERRTKTKKDMNHKAPYDYNQQNSSYLENGYNPNESKPTHKEIPVPDPIPVESKKSDATSHQFEAEDLEDVNPEHDYQDGFQIEYA